MKKSSLLYLFISAIGILLGGCSSAVAETVDLKKLLPAELQNAAGEAVSRDTLDGKLIGIYFSAEWCPPCRAFTPGLVEFRDRHADAFEVVFVSSDQSAAAQQKYMQNYHMNFLAVPFDSDARSALAEAFSVRGIPTLVILDSKGKVITTHGRAELSSDGDKVLKKWQSQAS